MSFQIAFAGTGYIAKIHAQAARNCGASLAAVVNHRAESMTAFAREWRIPRQYTSLDALLTDGGVDALVISTPNALHCPQALTALQAGVPVLVEKPMAMNANEAAQMVAAAAQSGAALMVAHCWRFDEDVCWLKDQLPHIGKVVRTKGYGVHQGWGPGGWFLQPQLAGGGALADMGIHAIDTVRFLLGDPQPLSVYARLGTYYRDIPVDDTGLTLINWSNGVTSYIESGWWQPHSDGVEASTQFYGAAGFAELFPTRLILPALGNRPQEMLQPGTLFPRPDPAPQRMYDRQMSAFIDCVQTGRAPHPGGLEGWVNMQIVDAAYQSARTGQVALV